MSQLFARFSEPDAPFHLPGAAFLAAAILSACCFGIYWNAVREKATVRAAVEPAQP